jgi:hypothetical protein
MCTEFTAEALVAARIRRRCTGSGGRPMHCSSGFQARRGNRGYIIALPKPPHGSSRRANGIPQRSTLRPAAVVRLLPPPILRSAVAPRGCAEPVPHRVPLEETLRSRLSASAANCECCARAPARTPGLSRAAGVMPTLRFVLHRTIFASTSAPNQQPALPVGGFA